MSECQDDWDDHLPALLSAYRSIPHTSMGVSPFHMLYGVEIMPLDLVIGEIGWQKPKVHCPNEYVEWLRASLSDAHTVARTNLKKSNDRREVMAKPVVPLSFSAVTGFGTSVDPFLVESCVAETEASGWCWQKQVL